MDAEHTAAVLARLRAHTHLATRVVDGPAGSKTAPYVVVYVYTPDERRTKLQGGSDEATVSVITHSVASTAEGARIVRRNVRQQLLDHVLDVAGWKCKPISHMVGRAPDWDESTGTRVMDAVDEWDYVVEPV